MNLPTFSSSAFAQRFEKLRRRRNHPGLLVCSRNRGRMIARLEAIVAELAVIASRNQYPVRV